MNQRTLGSVVAAVAALGFAVSASAAQKPAFEKADQNGDGKVSIQEAVQAGAPKKEAKSADIDNDGKLTKTDWTFVEMKTSQSGS